MSQQHLDNPEIDAVLKQMRSKAVPQRVNADPLDETSRFGRRPTGSVQDLDVYPLVARPGNSHVSGCARRQYVRKIPKSCGESMTVRSLPPLPWRILISIRSLSIGDLQADRLRRAKRLHKRSSRPLVL